MLKRFFLPMLLCFLCLSIMSVAKAQVKVTEFSEHGTTIAAKDVKMAPGAVVLRQMSAPLNANGETILLNVYKSNGSVFMDVLTSKNNQPWRRRNMIRIKSPVVVRPENMTVTMRYLNSGNQKGVMIIGSDDNGHVALMFPKGVGGTAYQQQFLVTAKSGNRYTYDFTQNDSRGFVMIKSSLESSGDVVPKEKAKFYAWNGKTFVPRAWN